MRKNAIYFPYIRVPTSQWFNQTLLYWGEVSTILPDRYRYSSDGLDDDLQRYIAHGLVTPRSPMQFAWKADHLPDVFEEFVAKKVECGAWRLTRQSQLVHMEKLGEVGRRLERCGWAVRDSRDWYQVEATVASHFMALLAACMGRDPEIDALPVTDVVPDLTMIAVGASRRDRRAAERWQVRQRLLEVTLPVPHETLSMLAVRQFKDEFGDLAVQYRVRIEELVMQIGAIEDEEARSERLELEVARLDAERQRVEAAFLASGFGGVRPSGIVGLIGAGGGLGALALAGQDSVASTFALVGAAFGAGAHALRLWEDYRQPGRGDDSWVAYGVRGHARFGRLDANQKQVNKWWGHRRRQPYFRR